MSKHCHRLSEKPKNKVQLLYDVQIDLCKAT